MSARPRKFKTVTADDSVRRGRIAKAEQGMAMIPSASQISFELSVLPEHLCGWSKNKIAWRTLSIFGKHYRDVTDSSRRLHTDHQFRIEVLQKLRRSTYDE